MAFDDAATGLMVYVSGCPAEVPAVGNVSTLTVASSRAIAATDNRKILRCSLGITLTIPSGLNPRPRFIVEFDSGAVSVATSGPQINGATTTIARTSASNPAGFAVVPKSGSDAYGVSGA